MGMVEKVFYIVAFLLCFVFFCAEKHKCNSVFKDAVKGQIVIIYIDAEVPLCQWRRGTLTR